jgi:uncharacterized protein YxeA
MKKYLLGIIAIVMAVGFSAFTVKTENAKVDGELYWILETDDTFYTFRTQTAEETATNCTGSMANCAYGYTAQPTLVNGHYIPSGSPVVTLKEIN